MRHTDNKGCVTGTRTFRVLETIQQFPIRITTLATALLATGSLFMASPPAAAQTGLGYALAFDGVDDSVYVAPHPALDLTTGTIEFWVKPGNLVGNACILANRGWTDAQTRFSVHLSTNAIGLFDGTALRTVPFSAVAGQWYHIALVCTGGDTEVFVDGISRGFTGNAFNPSVTGQPLNIGATYDNSGNGNLAERFTGTLDEVRLWNVARSPTEIANNLRLRLTGTEANLVACYRFDEAEGIIAWDATTNQCHGQLINRPLRVPSFWWPVVTVNGADRLTNECHVPFVDAGASVTASPLAISAGYDHSLVLKADGTVADWRYNNGSGQTFGTNVVAIKAGYTYSLALMADGTVVGWGWNDNSKANGALAGSNVVAIAAGGNHSLALKTDGTVVGWGAYSSGAADGALAGTNVVAIAAGHNHSLSLRTDGTVVSWGWNDFGQTNGMPDGSNVVAIAAGGFHSLSLRANGTVIGWGHYDSGQTNGALAGSNVVAIAAGGNHSLALKADGTVVGWGSNFFGQTNGALAGSNVVAIAAGWSHSLALRADGTIIAWGDNLHGQTNVPAAAYSLNLPITVIGMVDANVPGTYELTYRITNALGVVGTATRTVVVVDTRPPVLTLLGDNPLMVELGVPFVDPGATATDLCAGDLTGSIVSNLTVNPNLNGVYTNTYTVTDASGNTTRATRTVVVGAPLATTLEASNLVNNNVTLNGTVNPLGAETAAWFEWGTSTRYGNTTEPINVGSGTNAVTVSFKLSGLTPGAIYHFRVVATNSPWLAYGKDQTFWLPALSLNSVNPLTNECHVSFVDPITVNAVPQAIAASMYHNLALKADGTVVGWGWNIYGQTNSALAGANVVAIAAGALHSLALKSDGTVVGWGDNAYGRGNGALAGSNVVAIAAGYNHNLALKSDGTAVGWGRNDYGQTNGALAGSNVVAVAAGENHSLALKSDGTVVGWGRNDYGQTNGALAGSNVVAIAAGYNHSLALRANGTVVSWGANGYRLADGTIAGSNVVAIAAGYYHSLALKADGTVIGWGLNDYGQTNGALAGSNVVAIAAGGNHSLALRKDGSVIGWGWNNYGQTNVPVGLNTLNLPIAVSGTVNVNVPGTYELTYSVTNALGAIGMATRTVVVADTRPPVLTLLGNNPVILNVGASYTDPGAIAPDLCAGNLTGNIVSNLTANPDLPGAYTNTFAVTDSSGNTALAARIVKVGLPLVTTRPAADLTNGAVTFNGTVYPRGAETLAWFEWGTSTKYDNLTEAKDIGNGTIAASVSQQMVGLKPGLVYHYRVVVSNSAWVVRGADQTFWTPALRFNSANPLTNECHVPFVDPITVNASLLAIAAGSLHSLALQANGTVVGWGRNNYGQTNGVLAGSNIVAIAAGSRHSLALRANGTVVGWGANDYGQANGALAGSNVVAIAAGSAHSLALRADGIVVGWGANDYGQTNGALAGSNVVAIAAGSAHRLALRADGIVVGWGANDYGQANGALAGSNVVAIAAGGSHSLALKADGTVVGWGDNNDGQTNGALAGSSVVAIAAGTYHSLALKADGTVIGWGDNGYGQANGTLAGSNVVAIAAGVSHSLALRADDTVICWGANTYGQTNTPAELNILNLPIAVNGTVDANVPGTYELTYRVTNALGAVGTATRTVVVADTRPPDLTLLGDNPTMITLGMPYADPGATATDLCAGDLTGSIVSNLTVNPNLAGVYTNTYTVTDASGNQASIHRTVVVISAPEFAGVVIAAPGQLRLQGPGIAGLTYTVQVSTNLVDWVNHASVTAGPDGVIDYVEALGNDNPARFYRLKWP